MAAEEITLETNKLTEFLEKVEVWQNRWETGERAFY